MSWAQFAIEKLQRGETAKIRPRDHSMTGKVNDGDLVTVEPFKPENLAVGDIVLVKVKGNVYLHLIKPLMTGAFSSGTIAVVLTLGWARTAFTSTYAALEFLHA